MAATSPESGSVPTSPGGAVDGGLTAVSGALLVSVVTDFVSAVVLGGLGLHAAARMQSAASKNARAVVPVRFLIVFSFVPYRSARVPSRAGAPEYSILNVLRHGSQIGCMLLLPSV